MLLQITITYFNGAGRDVLNFHNLTTEQASTHRQQVLGGMQAAIENGQIFHISGADGDKANTLAFGPALLRDAHIRFDIVDE